MLTVFKWIIIINNLIIISIIFKVDNYKLTVIIFIDNLIDILIFKINNLYYLYFFNGETAATFKLKFKINNMMILLSVENTLIIIIILIVLYL